VKKQRTRTSNELLPRLLASDATHIKLMIIESAIVSIKTVWTTSFMNGEPTAN
jgi:hypothetical protein